MSTKRIVIGLGVVIAIALGIASFKGVIPPKSGVEGTIGAAKRYQTTQISAGDVTLTDAEMQDLLQSDLFHQIVTDANFRDLLRTQSESFRTVLMDKQFRDLMGKTGFAEVLRSDVFKTAVEQNRYDLLAKANPADFQRTQLAERTPTLDRASAEQLRTQVTQARTDVARTQAAYDKSVTELLKSNAVAGKQDVVARVESAKAQDVMARTEVAKAASAYDKSVTELSKLQLARTEVAKADLARTDAAKTTTTADRQVAIARVEQYRTELAKANAALDKTSAAYQRQVAELSKLTDVARQQEMLGRVDASRTSADAARTQLASAYTAYDRTINAALHVDVERASAVDYSRAQELSRTEAFKAVFADANFRQVATSDQFAKLVTMDRFQQVAKMDNFQKAMSNPDVLKQVLVADAERTETVK
jgi:hypothetical protein